MLGMVPPDPTSLAPSRSARTARSSAVTCARLGRGAIPRALQAHDHELAPTISTSGSSSIRSRRRSPRAASSARSSGRVRRARRTCCCITTWARSTARSARGGFSKGGNGAVSEAIASAARAFGAEIRTERAGRAGAGEGRPRDAASCSRTATRSPRRSWSPGSIRAARSSSSSRRKELPDELVEAGRALQVPRLVGQGESRADRSCRSSPACRASARTTAARSRSARASSISSAPTTTPSTASSRATRTWTSSFPSMIDPGMAPPGKHVMSIFVQYAPYNIERRLDRREARGVRRHGDRHARASTRRTSSRSILHRQVLTPADIERITGLSEGNIFQGELALHQLFFLRPAAHWAKYRTPIAATGSAAPARIPAAASWARRAGSRRWRSSRDRAADVRRRRSGFDAIVIGAGSNGLVAAAALGRPGDACSSSRRAEAIGGQSANVGVRSRVSRRRCPPTPAGFRRASRALGSRLAGYWCDDAKRRRRRWPATGGLSRCPCDRAPRRGGHPQTLAARRRAMVVVHRATRKARGLSRSALPTPATRRRRSDVVRRARRRCFGLGRKFRALGRDDMTELLRVMPMSVQDLLDDWFESPRRSRRRSPPAAFATFGRARVPAARRSCCCTISSALRQGSVATRLVARRTGRVHRDGAEALARTAA